MGCEIEETDYGVRITCTRGLSSTKNKIVVIDRQNNKWFVNATKEEFNVYPDDRSVEVFNENCAISKKFMKRFLKLES